MPTAADRFSSLLEQHVARRAPLERDAHVAEWDLSLTGSDEAAARTEKLETELKAVLSDPDTFGTLDALRASGEITDADTRRQLDRLWMDFAGNQVPQELLARIVSLEVKAGAVFSGFRAKLDGRDLTENEVRDILGESDDVAHRRRTWEASKEIGGALAPIVRELVELRNEGARKLGFRDYYAQSLELQEIDEGFLFGILEDLERQTQEPYDEWLGELFGRLGRRFGCSAADIRPWHLADPFFQEAVPPADVDADRFYADADLVELTRDALGRMGFPISGMIDRSDLFPRPGKNQHAFCTHIDRMTDDIRVLCNCAPNAYWMDTMLHEYGHAVYDERLGPDLPWMLRDAAHTLSTEAIALLFGRLATHPDWMIRVAGAPAAEVNAMADGLAAMSRTKQILFPRWVMVMSHFERELYGNPDADLNSLWWDLVERFQKVKRPEGRDAPDWASKVHVALAPVYYHNYLLGDLMASQLDGWLQREVTDGAWFQSADTARLLTEKLFRHGARRPW
ncbi:MAG: peptidase M3, partial [Gemmatimonadetes bacterium]|nr:peptidase M3 [Gemmatimonadota bacterium]